MEHTLQIHSLHDADATCSCGGWSLISTGQTTEAHIDEQFQMHANPQLTLKQWKAGLRVGMKLRCTFRWYWNQPHHKPAPPDGFELCELIEVRATQCIMRTPTAARSFLYYPNACNLKATAKGFELYFPDNDKEGYLRGKLMSRYEYI